LAPTPIAIEMMANEAKAGILREHPRAVLQVLHMI
jgi:hypothetical protein